MAIFPTATNNSHVVAAPSAADLDAWADEAVQAVSSINIAGGPVGGVTLALPLDEPARPHSGIADGADRTPARGLRPDYARHREPLRRDSLKRREALQKGKEGSRRRQRWENAVVEVDQVAATDRLLNNPYAQPPLPVDWEVRPTYPVHAVPYYLAPLWDAELAARSAAKKAKSKSKPNAAAGHHATTSYAADNNVPKELRAKLKRARGAKGLLQGLEEEVRRFVEKWEAKQREKQAAGMIDPDSSDDEIVFVGRNGRMSDLPPSPTTARGEELLEPHKLVFDSPADDQGASFGRWLVHSIGDYYGLKTWSVTVGDPARREAYVSIKNTKLKAGRSPPSQQTLPKPLWGMV